MFYANAPPYSGYCELKKLKHSPADPKHLVATTPPHSPLPCSPPSLTAPYRVGAVGAPAAPVEGQGVGPRGRCGSRGTEVWEGGVGGRCGREVWEGGVRGVGGRCGTCGRCGWKGWELSVVARCGHPQSDWCTPSK